MTDRLVTPHELAVILDIKPPAVARARRDGRLPPYDMQVSQRRCGWKVETLLGIGFLESDFAHIGSPESATTPPDDAAGTESSEQRFAYDKTPTGLVDALYRQYDQDGRLLYVGVSMRVHQRLREHIGDSPWASLIARIEITWFNSRQEALDAETIAIRSEHPVFNVRHAARANIATYRDRSRDPDADRAAA